MLAPESGKDKAPKPGTLTHVFSLLAVKGMTGTTCKSIAEIRVSMECSSDAAGGSGGLAESCH